MSTTAQSKVLLRTSVTDGLDPDIYSKPIVATKPPSTTSSRLSSPKLFMSPRLNLDPFKEGWKLVELGESKHIRIYSAFYDTREGRKMGPVPCIKLNVISSFKNGDGLACLIRKMDGTFFETKVELIQTLEHFSLEYSSKFALCPLTKDIDPNELDAVTIVSRKNLEKRDKLDEIWHSRYFFLVVQDNNFFCYLETMLGFITIFRQKATKWQSA